LSEIGRHSAALHCARALGRRRTLRQQGRVGTRGLALALAICAISISVIWLLQMRQPGLLLCGNAGLFKPAQVEPFNAGPGDIGCSLTFSKGASSWRPLSRLRGTAAITRNSAWRTFSEFSPEMQLAWRAPPRPVEVSQLWVAFTLCAGLSLSTGAAGCGP
jgi:hypothetical protein